MIRRTSSRAAGVGRVSLGVTLLLLVVSGGSASSAAAASAAPGWEVDSLATPSNFSSTHAERCVETEGQATPVCDIYRINVRNSGSQPTDGSALKIRDELPAGMAVKKITLTWSGWPEGLCDPLGRCGGEADLNTFSFFSLCSHSAGGEGEVAECRLPTGEFGLPAIAPDDRIEMAVYVTVEGSAGSVVNHATASGGGAAESAAPEVPTELSAAPAKFGVSLFRSVIAGLDGSEDRQAADHPYEFTTRIDLRSVSRRGPGELAPTSVEDVRDIVIDLPVGFLGSAVATPTCSFARLSSQKSCPGDTQVGHLLTRPGGGASVNGPLYNITPERGVVAEFGFEDAVDGSHVITAHVVPTSEGYVLQAVARELPQIDLTNVVATLYGDPAERDGGGEPLSMFTNPSVCGGAPIATKIYVDSWQHPGPVNADGAPALEDPRWVGASSFDKPTFTGCNLLQFSPTLEVRPDTAVADSPSGLSVTMSLPQPEQPGALATPPLRDASVTLPAGFTVDPSSATGLGSCSTAQIGLGDASQPSCPDSAKVGTVRVVSPLLATPLAGSIYLAVPNENPFGSLLAAYIVIDDPITGVVVKIPGKLELGPEGRITGSFDQNPQFPFSALELRFFGGSRGDIATSRQCGTYEVTSELAPWSAPDSGPLATPSDRFETTTGCTGSFTPSFVAGTTNPLAGGYSPFTVSLSRQDGEQELSGLSVSLPSGLLAKLAGVGRCSDAAIAQAMVRSGREEARSPSCPAGSAIGTVTAGAGPGPTPFTITGAAYLTGPYNGAPFGIAVIVPAIAGPFDLGDVVVRQALRIDPSDAHVTDVSDPFPTVLHVAGSDGHVNGFPIRLRSVRVAIDRPGFTLNPTSCEAKTISGAFSSAEGATSTVASHFQADGCRALGFAPAFSATSPSHTSRSNGASLTVKIGSSSGQANIAKVHVVVPAQLPSRQSTLKEACPARVFEKNPAACPRAANVGSARATTPLLDSPLSGPAYLVSHGGEAFPDLVVVLQGEGITLDLVGNTLIRRGITSSTFNAVPDAPVSSFELILPGGPRSLLGAFLPAKANGSLCGQKLVMPTTITAQNGLVKHQSTKIAVTGCHKKKATARARSSHRKKARH